MVILVVCVHWGINICLYLALSRGLSGLFHVQHSLIAICLRALWHFVAILSRLGTKSTD